MLEVSVYSAKIVEINIKNKVLRRARLALQSL